MYKQLRELCFCVILWSQEFNDMKVFIVRPHIIIVVVVIIMKY